jgi:hypothetical protein
VPASQAYIPGLTVFLKSFWHYHKNNDIGVILLNYDLPTDYIKQWPFEKVVQLKTDKPPAMICKLASYLYVASLDRVTMLADADSFFCASMYPWFEIAGLGYIVGSANGQNIPFTKKYEDATGIQGIAGKHNYRTIAAPLIIDPRQHGQVYKDAVNAWYRIGTNHGTSIWMLMNAMMLKHDKLDKIISIPAQQCTNLHQKMLKPCTRVRMDHGRLMTEDGLEVLMCHDKWWKQNFLDGLMIMGNKFSKSFDRQEAHTVNQWKQSRDLLKAEFDRWL